MTTHEVMITPDGVIKKKNLPTDAFYKAVNIRESRKPTHRITNRIQTMEEQTMEGQTIEEQTVDETTNENEEETIMNNNLDVAFMEDDSMRDLTSKRIMTNAEIEAELYASSDDSDSD